MTKDELIKHLQDSDIPGDTKLMSKMEHAGITGYYEFREPPLKVTKFTTSIFGSYPCTKEEDIVSFEALILL